LDSTIKAARLYAAGQAVAAGIVSAQVAALAQGVMTAMFLSQVKVAMGILLVTVTIVGGAGVLVSQAGGPAGSPDAQQKVVAPSTRELPPDTLPTVAAAADEIANAYQSNAAFADERFAGKRVTVTGKILRIRGARLPSQVVSNKNATGVTSLSSTPSARIYYLEMSAKTENPRAGSVIVLVRCQFTQDSRDQLAKLKVGQQVSVEGQLLEPSESSGGIVTLIEFHKCRVVASKEN
jgi:hypothetical protein